MSHTDNIAKPIPYTFFGSAIFSLYVLDELKKAGMLPIAVVTTPDKPKGRKLILTPNPVKVWALENSIPFFDTYQAAMEDARVRESAVFIVAAYGKILPQAVIDTPKYKTLNIHPSLLPHHRGASPLQSAMLDDQKNTGVSIMRIDAEMDHGPIIAQKNISVSEWPTYEIFEEMMAREGGKLLAETLPQWVTGKIAEKEQNHAIATYTKKIKKEDGEITFDPEASSEAQYAIFRKIQAYHEWPTAFFFADRNGKKIRVKITQASFSDGTLKIEKVIPEGKPETSFERFY